MEKGSAPVPSSVPLLGSSLEDALDAGLRKAGVFCSLCGRTALPSPVHSATMTEYLLLNPSIEPGRKKPVVALIRLYHCGRDDCDPSEVIEKAQARRTVPAWELLDPETGNPSTEAESS